MGKIKNHYKVKLFFACTFHNSFNVDEFYEKIEKDSNYGKIYKYSEKSKFSNFSSYYEKEMGKDLNKQIITFDEMFQIENLHRVKIHTNKLEEDHAIDSKRLINIDPGYVTLAKVLLFSTKDNIHRIYINDGIFSEITLKFKDNTFNPLESTYNDYRESSVIEYFNSVRNDLKLMM